jgi:hypothetical protein
LTALPCAPPRARLTLPSLLAAVIAALVLLPGSAVADPGDEGSVGTLRSKLDAATRAYNNAKGRLAASQQKQKKLTKEIKTLEDRSEQLYGDISQLAVSAYKGGYASTFTVLMDAASPEDLTEGMTMLSYLASQDYAQIKEFTSTRDELAKKRYAVQLEMRTQRAQLKKMAKRKADALKALREAGSGDKTSGPSKDSTRRPSDGGGSGVTPSPRNPDGSWPSQSCSVDDPTTGGCLTPRTLHALREAREAGYTRYTKCWRESSGDHGAGRACDFAAFTDGFRSEDAYGSNKTYGDNLAGWFVANADALAVSYVIWYRRIWLPGSGWGTYHGGGDPASDHTNHVHISIQ